MMTTMKKLLLLVLLTTTVLSDDETEQTTEKIVNPEKVDNAKDVVDAETEFDHESQESSKDLDTDLDEDFVISETSDENARQRHTEIKNGQTGSEKTGNEVVVTKLTRGGTKDASLTNGETNRDDSSSALSASAEVSAENKPAFERSGNSDFPGTDLLKSIVAQKVKALETVQQIPEMTRRMMPGNANIFGLGQTPTSRPNEGGVFNFGSWRTNPGVIGQSLPFLNSHNNWQNAPITHKSESYHPEVFDPPTTRTQTRQMLDVSENFKHYEYSPSSNAYPYAPKYGSEKNSHSLSYINLNPVQSKPANPGNNIRAGLFHSIDNVQPFNHYFETRRFVQEPIYQGFIQV